VESRTWLIFWSWRWRRHVSSKRWLTFNGLHGVISQKKDLISVSETEDCRIIALGRPHTNCVKTSIKTWEKKRQKLTSASWLRPVCGGFHNLIRFNCAPFFAICRRHRVLTVTCLDACRCAAYFNLKYYYLNVLHWYSIHHICLCMALQPSVEPWPLLSFLIFYTVGRTPWMGDQPVARPLPTHRTTQTQNKRTHTHPCFKWDSNPWSQWLSGRRQLMP
jgi:hypothetical protein